MAYSISDNTTSSTTRKIVSYHRKMASPCIAFRFSFSLLSSSSFSVPYLPLQAATPDLYTCKRIHINLLTSALHSVAQNTSRSIDILGRYFRQFSKFLSTIKSLDWYDKYHFAVHRSSLFAYRYIPNLNIAIYVTQFSRKYQDIFIEKFAFFIVLNCLINRKINITKIFLNIF